MKKLQKVCEVYRDQVVVLDFNTTKAIKQAFKNKKCVIAFTSAGFQMFGNYKAFTSVFKIEELEAKCGKLKITENDLQEFSEAVDFAQTVSKQIKCKIFVMNF